MLSISLPLQGSSPEEYYLSLVREDYYADPLEEPGRWMGSAVRLLGLGERVERLAFRNLLQGRTPHGNRPLVQNAGEADRQCGWDLTLSAPKSVSVAWAIAPLFLRTEFERAQQEAVETAIAYLERYAGITRRGKGGSIKERAALLIAAFRHGSSRETDPQLHHHCVLINLALRSDGTTGSLHSLVFFKAKKKIGRIYRDALVRNLEQRLELVIEPEPVGFRIVGVPQSLCRELSKRSRAINIAMKARRLQGAVAAKVVALDTRPAKQPISREELFRRWQAIGEAHGWTAEHVRQLVQERTMTVQRGSILKHPLPQHLAIPANDLDLVSTSARELFVANANLLRNTSDVPSECLQSPSKVALSGAGESTEQGKAGQRTGRAADPEYQSQHSHGPKQVPRPDKDQHQRTTREKTGAQGQDRDGQGHPWQSTHGMDDAGSHTSSRSGGASGVWNRLLQIEWRWMFPRTRIGSVVDGWISPRLVILRIVRQARWGRVIWRQELPLGEVRIQQRRLFPQAPGWSAARQWKLPVLLFGDPKMSPRWGAIERSRSLPLGEARIQRRILFPEAPRWSPLRNVSLPAIRLAPKAKENRKAPMGLGMKQTTGERVESHRHQH